MSPLGLRSAKEEHDLWRIASSRAAWSEPLHSVQNDQTRQFVCPKGRSQVGRNVPRRTVDATGCRPGFVCETLHRERSAGTLSSSIQWLCILLNSNSSLGNPSTLDASCKEVMAHTGAKSKVWPAVEVRNSYTKQMGTNTAQPRRATERLRCSRACSERLFSSQDRFLGY